ncbi:MAG: response regulator transcription factor [Clostridiales bacterium]|nr:response regulator transcription factor [Clostridiales bacterium]
MYRIFIVEDDEIIADALCKHIKTWGYEANCVKDFQSVMKEFVAFSPQLILMDISLPFFNGYHWCNEIRKVSKVPIIFISSANDNMNIVMAMNMGGDDFIAKPFDLNVVMAKIQALLRRTYDFASQNNLIEHQGAILNTQNNTLTYQGESLNLTKNEYKILELLMESKGKIVSRDMIMTRLWETDSFIDDNTLTVNVTRLRKKLESVGLVDFILTKKGMGYLIGE